MHRYKQLAVWQLAVDLSLFCYETTSQFPADERFGLVSQLRRAAVSVASNIAEGAGRNSGGEFIHALGIAAGSLCEVDTQLHIASRLGFLAPETYQLAQEKIGELQNKIYRLIDSVRQRSATRTPPPAGT